jgi:hypothetical protein
MPIDSARRMSAFVSYRPKAAIPLSAKSGRLRTVGGRSRHASAMAQAAQQALE